MNQRSPGGLPGLGRKPSKPHLNTSVSLKKPKNFINFDDSEIFCDIKQQSMKDGGTTPAKLKTSRTIDGMMTSQRWHRKSSEHQLKSIVIGSQTSIKRLEDQKNFEILTRMLEIEQYFQWTKLPPTELHLSDDISRSFNIEHEALDRCMAAVELLAESNQRTYPRTAQSLSQVMRRNIYFEYSQLDLFKSDLESICSQECVSLMRSGETTWRTFSSILASEAARGLAKERDNLNKANLEIERLEQRYRELEYSFTNENSKLKIAQLESFIAEERGSKQELENRLKNALSELASKVTDLTNSERERIELNKLQSQVEFEYQSFKNKINQLENGRIVALSEMQKLKDHYNEILFSFNENVEASVKMMVKLQAAKREIDYLANKNSSLRMKNESLVDKHLIGIDQLTPRPRIREMIDENRVKLDFPKDYDTGNTEAKIVWLVERIYDPSKVKYMKKKNQLKRNSSVYMMAQDRSLQSTVSPRSELIDINQSEKPEITVAHNETLSVDKEDQTFFIKINKMKNKYNLKVAEMN